LGTGLLLWFLTTVLVGLVTFSYQKHQESNSRKAEEKRLVTETDGRLDELSHRLAVIHEAYTRGGQKAADLTWGLKFVRDALDTSPDSEEPRGDMTTQPVSYPEYRSLSLIELARRLADSNREAAVFAEELIELKNLTPACGDISTPCPFKQYFSYVREWSKGLDSNLRFALFSALS
jgi:hypothetical protein